MLTQELVKFTSDVDMAHFSDSSVSIAARQYFQPEDENIPGLFRRVAGWIATPDPESEQAAYAETYFNLMATKRFSPGGRVYAGAATTHGNVLNCFVQGSEHPKGSDDWVLEVAEKLALTTRVGGGNGVYLGDIPAKRVHSLSIGQVYLTLDKDHKDYDNFISGTIFDFESRKVLDDGTTKIGNYVKKGYHYAKPLPDPSLIPETGPNTLIIDVADSAEGIWRGARDMAKAMLDGRDVIVKLDKLRPEGAEVKGTHGVSSGPASFAVEIFDNYARWALQGGAQYAGPVATLRYVFAPTLRSLRQGGVRRGAGMATINHDHPDLPDFITCKDLHREQAEGNISTFNISVLVSDEFMRGAKTNPVLKGVLREIADHAWQTGEPGLIYIGRINENNPMKEALGEIKATNPLRA